MAARSPLRFLAPIAIAVFLVAVVIVIASSDGGGGSDSTRSARRTTAAPTRVVSRRRTYRIRQGDTLTSIADKTGVPTDRLLSLNPGLDPQTLQPGERVKLRP
jgi:LysM repeat protein